MCIAWILKCCLTVDLVGGVVSLGEIRSYEDVFSSEQWALKNRYIHFQIRDLEYVLLLNHLFIIYIKLKNLLRNYLHLFNISRGVDLKCLATREYANEIFRKFNKFGNDVFLCVLRFLRVNIFGGTNNIYVS